MNYKKIGSGNTSGKAKRFKKALPNREVTRKYCLPHLYEGEKQGKVFKSS